MEEMQSCVSREVHKPPVTWLGWLHLQGIVYIKNIYFIYTYYINVFWNPELFISNYACVYIASEYMNVLEFDLCFGQRTSFITHINENPSKQRKIRDAWNDLECQR